jgi:24-hydroxycholesterol 7alpha-hydroxylase
MTFLLDHSHSDVFFKSPSASFQGAAQSFTVAAANISPESFYQHHSKIHDIFKGRLTSSNLPPLCLSLSACFYQQLLNCKEKEIELIQLVRDIMFPIVFQQLCGNANLNLSQDQMDLVQDKFIKYDAGFEYAQLPSILNREWCGTKTWLLDVFKDVVMKFVQRNEPPQSVFEHIISSVDGDNAAGYALMMLWASQANAIPIAFWTLSFVLSHPKVLEKIKDELKDLSFVNESEINIGFSQCYIQNILIRYAFE